MSRTKKDLKSHKDGVGEFHHKPQRKLTPFSHEANKITGENKVLMGQPENDISQDDFKIHGYNGKSVRAIRKSIRAQRDYITSSARTKLKQFDKQNLDNLTEESI
jgi:hypothetical protein